jgi:S-formylglutathione hydrolase FrmB
MSLFQINFNSTYLQGNTNVNIIMPDCMPMIAPGDFYGSGKRYKVLWLLHGAWGDGSDWVRKSRIEDYATKRDLVVVMPSALNSFYTNWENCMMGYRMGDFLTEELMPMVYNWLPVSDKKEDNYIAGLSMGGYGTLRYTAAYPDKFAGAACLSFAPEDARTANIGGAVFDTTIRKSQIDNAGGMEGYLASDDNLWDRLPEKKDALPPIYMACGQDDFLYKHYVKFKAHAEETGLNIKFSETPGFGHEWGFWDIEIQNALLFFGLEEKALGRPF